MLISIIAKGSQKEEWLSGGTAAGTTVEWMEEIKVVPGTDCYIDLLFDGSESRLKKLAALAPAFIIVNETISTLDQLPGVHARINGWPGFLERALTEAAGPEELQANAEKFLSVFNRSTEWVKDEPGFISARVISMIINEAYHALDENVSSKEAIDTAMKLGTNYPFGPFAWAEKIGLKKVYLLLVTLAKGNDRYTPSALLKKEADA